jgi:hypothetical protein
VGLLPILTRHHQKIIVFKSKGISETKNLNLCAFCSSVGPRVMVGFVEVLVRSAWCLPALHLVKICLAKSKQTPKSQIKAVVISPSQNMARHVCLIEVIEGQFEIYDSWYYGESESSTCSTEIWLVSGKLLSREQAGGKFQPNQPNGSLGR